jgi:hypothetical protein
MHFFLYRSTHANMETQLMAADGMLISSNTVFMKMYEFIFFKFYKFIDVAVLSGFLFSNFS